MGECSGTIIPSFSSADTPQGVSVVYFLLLMWCFFGVAASADIFMAAIEMITSRTRIVERKKQNGEVRQVELKTWNATVANLTLMALGSSAPEILLNVIELFTGSFYSGSLGPSTIVGSAAFNLLFIIGICVASIPAQNLESGESGYRKIMDVGVYFITAVFSIFAYVWLLFILMVITPDVVTIPEAVITFLFFPVLVILSFAADKGYFSSTGEQRTADQLEHVVGVRQRGLDEGAFGAESIPQPGRAWRPFEAHGIIRELERTEASIIHKQKREEQAAFVDADGKRDIAMDERKIQQQQPPVQSRILDMDPVIAAKMISRQWMKKKKVSRAVRRMQAIRSLTGGKSIQPIPTEELTVPDDDDAEFKGKQTPCIYRFAVAECSVLESKPFVEVTVQREYLKSVIIPTFASSVHYHTEGGTATPDEDYVSVKDAVLEFAPGESEKTIRVQIIDDNEWEPDEQFFIVLDQPSEGTIVPENKNKMQVTIINDDIPGVLSFAQTEWGTHHAEYITSEKLGHVNLTVIRQKGASGIVSCKYKTVSGSAMGGSDYKEVDGEELVFQSGEYQKTIEITIIDDDEYEKDEQFTVKLYDAKDCQLGGVTTAFVTISNDDKMKTLTDRVTYLLNLNMDKYRIAAFDWKEQINDAIAFPTRKDYFGEDDDGTASLIVPSVLHVIAVPWKLFCAVLIPPLSMRGGVFTFFASLFVIGIITALIGDLASMFGCSIGLDDAVTAITFVALGTSLPDTFASRSAAIGDDSADSSVGNVTGSNSVNVFLGLGLLPWSSLPLPFQQRSSPRPSPQPSQTPSWRRRCPRRQRHRSRLRPWLLRLRPWQTLPFLPRKPCSPPPSFRPLVPSFPRPWFPPS